MNESIADNQWLQYVELPVRARTPATASPSAETGLAERVAAFMRSRKVQPFTDSPPPAA